MADITRTFEVPNRVPGKLVFGPKRVLATFGSIETPTPADLPDVLCPQGPTSQVPGQAICGLPLCVGTSKEIIDFTNFVDDALALTAAKVVQSFPVVAGNAQSTNVSGTSHTVSLPASIGSGETLIAIMAMSTSPISVTFPAGWTKIFDFAGTSSLAIAWRKADGGEGASITVTSASAVVSANVTYRITGATDPTVQPPEVSAQASASDANPDPALLSPAFPAAHLWIACYAGNGAGPELTLPSGYGNDQSHAGASVHIGAGDRNLLAITENPGTFTKTGTAQWRAATVVIYPS